jgi:hypothetical protein
MESRGVDEDDLTSAGEGHDPRDAMPRRLRDVGDRGELLADESVQ